jgi:S-DNA-T family DNA segregation ATPase FtsK/SpoIIIE
MGKKKNTPTKQKENAKPKNPKKQETTVANGWFSKLIRISGLFLLLFSIFLLISFLSYCFGAWKTDDIFTGDASSFTSILLNSNIKVSNWTGRLGASLSYLFVKQLFGVASFLFPFYFFIVGFKLLFKRNILPLGRTFQILFIVLVLLSVGLGYLFPNEELSLLGGVFGHIMNGLLTGIMGKVGTGILIFFVYLSFLILAFNISFRWILRRNVVQSLPVVDGIPEINEAPVLETTEEEIQTIEFDLKKPEPEIIPITKKIEKADPPVSPEITFTVNTNEAAVKEQEEAAPTPVPVEIIPEKDDIIMEITEPEEDILEVVEIHDENLEEHIPDLSTPYDPRLDLSSYKFPPIDLLLNYNNGSTNVKKEELEENKNKIVQTLNNYSISIDKIIATIGPTVTLYEIVPSPGVRISRIKNLEDDIALSLSAYGIRIIAPIPGKGTIGIEVPNQYPEIVSMRSIIASDKYQNSGFELPIAIGKTISNESFVTDLTKMPHLLMAGATGQGKSVGLNAIITSILYKKHPAEVKFVMVDPKKVELTLFSKIERHYLAKLPDYEEAIITDIRKVVRVLNSMCIEMDNRYNLLKDAQVRNIKEYNAKFLSRKLNPLNGHRYLPYIIMIVDEFADLIMTAGKEIEAPITRLAQLARAIGIHLIIATQRPSVNIITGTIKANFPARVAFRVTSKIDSRTILDAGGAEQLVGRGDMLLTVGSDLIRLQCAFVDIGEIEQITEFIGSQRGYLDAYHLPEYFEEGDESSKVFDSSDKDDLFEDAARLIVQHQQGSTSLIQRKMKLGYNRAGRIIDQLEAAGIVGPFEGSKAREVLVKDMTHLEQILNSF